MFLEAIFKGLDGTARWLHNIALWNAPQHPEEKKRALQYLRVHWESPIEVSGYPLNNSLSLTTWAERSSINTQFSEKQLFSQIDRQATSLPFHYTFRYIIYWIILSCLTHLTLKTGCLMFLTDSHCYRNQQSETKLISITLDSFSKQLWKSDFDRKDPWLPEGGHAKILLCLPQWEVHTGTFSLWPTWTPWRQRDPISPSFSHIFF